MGGEKAYEFCEQGAWHLVHLITVSIAGGVFHNVGQVIVAMLVLSSGYVAYYLPVLWFSGIAAGAVIGLISVSIVSPDGCLADGLSTALFVMGREKALAYWDQNRDTFDAILVEADGSITVTAGLEGTFSSELPFEVVL